MWISQLLAILLAAAVFASGFNGLRLLPYATWGDFMFVVVGIVWLILWPLQRHKKMPLFVGLSFLLFVLAYALYAYFNGGPAPDENLAEIIKLLVSLFLITYLIFDIVRDDATLRLLMWTYVASATANAAIGMSDLLGTTQFAVWLNVQTVYDYEFVLRAHGLTVHPNHLGQHCAMALFLLIGLRRKGVRVTSWLQAIAATILLLGIMASGSRGALITTLGISIFLGIWYARHIPRPAGMLIIALTVGAFAVLLSAFQSEQIGTAWFRLSSPDAEVLQSDTTRLELYRNAWLDFMQHPIAGTGYASIVSAHDIYLQVLQSAGLVGMLALVLYVITPLWIIRKQLGTKQLDHVALGVAASVGIFLTAGLVANLIYVRPISIVLGFLWVVAGRKLALQSAGSLASGYKHQ